MGELENIMERIKRRRSEYKDSGVNYSQLAIEATTFSFSCDRCRNKNENFLLKDAKSGDVICLGPDGKGTI